MSDVTGTAVQQDTLTFGSEDERVAAMEALADTQDGLEQLDRIRNAAIVPKPEDGEGGEPAIEQPEPQPQAAAMDVPQATTPTAPAATGPVNTPFLDALHAAGFTYRTEEEAIKGLKEKDSYIIRLKEQEAYIKEQLRGGNDNAQKRIAELEAELSRAKAAQQPVAPVQQSQPPTGAQSGSIADTQSTLAGIQAEIAELRKLDPYDPEYQERRIKLDEMQAQALSNFASAQAATQSEIERQRAAEQAAQEARQQREQEARATQAALATYAEADAAGNDPELAEFKLSKPAVEVEREFGGWRLDIASAYYGRRPANQAEFEHAIQQFEERNPDTLQKCKVAGIPTEMTRDMATLNALYDAMDYRDGWHRDALTGQLKRNLRYDPTTGQNVPVILPDLKTAIKMKRLNEGYYKQREDNAYQRGATSFAAAMAKRDPAVGELNDPSTMGTSGNASTEWAVQFLTDVDVDEAMRRFRHGDPSMFNKMNEARGVLSMPPVVFSQ